ncbi:Z-ring formation inhibitor MciZ [Peribacillus sp. NPDC097295]|uniref:Z-ring formation inhibitor MciZ n=1 Tax=Peribacillus sp. NPDC097295 TaxID=3364402 RepID=UPI0038081F7F
MKIHVFENGMVFSGKSWEIIQKLKNLQSNYVYISDWIADIHQQEAHPLKRIK